VTRVGEERKLYRVFVGKPEGKYHSEDRGVNGRMGPLCDWLGGAEWIQLAQDRDRWPALMNAVMSLRVLVPRC
jgi:hypothetical protein